MAAAGSQMLASSSPGATSVMSMRRSFSSPAMREGKVHHRLSDSKPPLPHRLEDETHTYFVPNSLRRVSAEQLRSNCTLSKLSKDKKIVMTFGDGTGFRSQGAGADWWP